MFNDIPFSYTEYSCIGSFNGYELGYSNFEIVNYCEHKETGRLFFVDSIDNTILEEIPTANTQATITINLLEKKLFLEDTLFNCYKSGLDFLKKNIEEIDIKTILRNSLFKVKCLTIPINIKGEVIEFTLEELHEQFY